jgi:hypothetical protein
MYKLMEPPAYIESYPQTLDFKMTTFLTISDGRIILNICGTGAQGNDNNQVLDPHAGDSCGDVCIGLCRAPIVVGARLCVDRAHYADKAGHAGSHAICADQLLLLFRGDGVDVFPG